MLIVPLLLLALALAGYYLAKQTWKRWHENDLYQKTDAVVTAQVHDSWDLSELDSIWKGDSRHMHTMEWCITLEAEDKRYCVRTEHLFGVLYWEGRHTALYLPKYDDELCPLLPLQRMGALHFAAAVLLCVLPAAGIVWYVMQVLQLQNT